MALNLSSLPPQEQVATLFIAYFDRAPAPSGLDYWAGKLTSGEMTIGEIATSFSKQLETLGLYPELGAPNAATPESNLALVTDVFQNLFGRPPANGPDNYYVQQLNDGADIGKIIIQIANGAVGADKELLENKIEVGLDWASDALIANIATSTNPLSAVVDGELVILDQEAYNSAKSVLDGVTDDDATVDAAKAATDAFIDGYGNDAPEASADAATVDAEGVLNDFVSATDPDGDDLVYSIAPGDGPSNGTLDMNDDGTYTYTPDAGFSGSDSFTYTATDPSGETDTATVSITVTNDAPDAAPDAAVVAEDTVLNDFVSATDPDGDDLVYSIAPGDGPSNGTLDMNDDGTYTYTPNADFAGSDNFTYTVTDPSGETDTATVSLTVTNVNDAPVASGVVGSTDEDTAVVITPSFTDVDAGDTATISIAAAPSNGTVAVNADGTITYTPDADYNGPDSFTYTVTDADGASSSATANITVGAVNDAPEAPDAPVAFDMVEDGQLTGQLQGSDVDGDALIFAVASGPTNGNLTINPNTGEFTYTPDADFNGSDTFTYTVTDPSGESDTATINVAVASADDILTAGQDDLQGGQGDDLYLANQNTLATGDEIDGAGGSDKLKVSILADGDFFAAPTLNSVETVEVNGPNLNEGQDITIDLSNADGVQELVSFQTTTNGNSVPQPLPSISLLSSPMSAPLVSFLDIQSVNNTDIKIIDTDANYLFTYDSNAFETLFGGLLPPQQGPKDDDQVDMFLQEVDGSIIDLRLENPVPGTPPAGEPGSDFRSHVDVVNITSAARQQTNLTDFNYVYDLNVGPVFTHLNINGDADFEIERFLEGPSQFGDTVIGGVNTVDARTLDGDLTLDLLGQGRQVPDQGAGPGDTPFDITGGGNPTNPNGELTVFGSIGDNDIDVNGDTNGTFTFQDGQDLLEVGFAVGSDADDATPTDGVFGDLTIDMGGNDDTALLNITGIQDVMLGGGSDTLTINGNVDDLGSRPWNDGVSTVDAGTGNDSVTLNGVMPMHLSNHIGQKYTWEQEQDVINNLDNNYLIDLGDGDDTLVANQGGDHTVTGGIGEDEITINGNGNQQIDSGGDDDDVDINGDGTHDILLGGGNDDLSIIGSRLTDNNVDAVFTTDNNVDAVFTFAITKIDAGKGDDTVLVDGDHDLEVLLGDGTDSIELNADELTVDDVIDGGNADGADVDDTVILNNDNGNLQDGSVGRSETSSTTGIEVFDLRDTNISLALSSDNFDTSVDGKITVKTTEALGSELITDGDQQVGANFADGQMTVDITDIPMSVASGRSFELVGGTIKDVIIADDASISSRLILDFDEHPSLPFGDNPLNVPGTFGDSREDTLRVVDGAHISAADQTNFSGLDIIELVADSNQAQKWTIEVTDRTINQSSDGLSPNSPSAPFKIQVDPNVGAGSQVFIDVDPSTYAASMDDPLLIETNANVEIYVDFNDGNGSQLIGEPLWGTELLSNFGLNTPFGGGIYVQERLIFTQNADSLIGDQLGSPQNDTFLLDSISKIQEADSADGKAGTNTLLFDNVTVSNQGESLYNQINTPELTSIQEFEFDTGMNVQMTRLDGGALGGGKGPEITVLEDMLDTVRTGSGNDTLLQMESIHAAKDYSEGYFLGGGDDVFTTEGVGTQGGTNDDSDDYYVDGGLGDDEATVADDDDLWGTDIELITLEGNADATVRTVEGTDGGTMTITGRPDEDNNNTVNLDSSIRQTPGNNSNPAGALATVVLHDIEVVNDGTAGDSQNNIIELDNERAGPDGDAVVNLNGSTNSTDFLTVTNVDDLDVTATNGHKIVNVGGTTSSVNTFDYNIGAPLNDDVDNITALVDEEIRIRAGDGDDIIVAETTEANSTMNIGGGAGDDDITATPDIDGGSALINSGDGADMVDVTTQGTATSTIITGLGGDGEGDMVKLYDPENVGDPASGRDTIVFGDIVYDVTATDNIVTADTTQNFLQTGHVSADTGGAGYGDSIDTIENFNGEGGVLNTEDIFDFTEFLDGNDGVPLDTVFGVPVGLGAGIVYGDWTAGKTNVDMENVGTGTQFGNDAEVAVIAVNEGFTLTDADFVTAEGAIGIEMEDGGFFGTLPDLGNKAVVITMYDSSEDADSALDTADIYFVQDVDADLGEVWAVDKVATVTFASQIGLPSLDTVFDDNITY